MRLVYKYTNQTLGLRWGHALSILFRVKNGVKQVGVLLRIVFQMYTHGLLKRLQETGVGRHMGRHFSGALTCADDLTLMSPCRSGLANLVKECYKDEDEYHIILNSKESQLLHFRD